MMLQAGIKGFEPLLPRPERGVLPLDDIPKGWRSKIRTYINGFKVHCPAIRRFAKVMCIKKKPAGLERLGWFVSTKRTTLPTQNAQTMLGLLLLLLLEEYAFHKCNFTSISQ